MGVGGTAGSAHNSVWICETTVDVGVGCRVRCMEDGVDVGGGTAAAHSSLLLEVVISAFGFGVGN